jgi:hypothetical protein
MFLKHLIIYTWILQGNQREFLFDLFRFMKHTAGGTFMLPDGEGAVSFLQTNRPKNTGHALHRFHVRSHQGLICL